MYVKFGLVHFRATPFICSILPLNRKRLLVAYSSGYGAAGVAATLSYAALTDIAFSPKATILVMLIIPLVQITAFWLIRQSNVNSSTTLDSSSTTFLIDNQSDENSPAMTALQPMTLAEKWEYLPKLMKYSIPLMITCWCEYTMGSLVSLMIEVLNSSPFISRNTFLQFDLLYVPGMRLTHADQYRWLEVYDVTC